MARNSQVVSQNKVQAAKPAVKTSHDESPISEISTRTHTSNEHAKPNHTSPILGPIQNLFFDLPCSQKVTDEELYNQFKADYASRGIERALWRKRRFQSKKRRAEKEKVHWIRPGKDGQISKAFAF